MKDPETESASRWASEPLWFTETGGWGEQVSGGDELMGWLWGREASGDDCVSRLSGGLFEVDTYRAEEDRFGREVGSSVVEVRGGCLLASDRR